MAKIEPFEVHSLAAERALREARGSLREIHDKAIEALEKLSEFSVASFSADQLQSVVQRFAEVKLMIAFSSPEVIKALESEMAARGRALTPKEKSTILSRIAPDSL